MSSQVTVTVSGSAGAGKSTIAALVASSLSGHGFDVKVESDEVPQAPHQTAVCKQSLVSHGTKVVIKMVQKPLR